MTTVNEGAGTKMVVDIVIGSMSKATEMDIVESGTAIGSIGIGSSGSHRDRDRASWQEGEGAVLITKGR